MDCEECKTIFQQRNTFTHMDDVLKNHHNVLNMFPDVISQMFIVDGFKSIFITNFMCDVYRKVHHMKPQNYKPLLIVGPPRVGKTTTLIWLYLQFSYQGHKCFLAALDSEILNKIYHELEETDPTTPMYFFCDFNDALSAGRDTYKSYKNVVSKLLVCVNSVTVISASSALLTAMYNSENTALRSFVTHHLYHSSTIIEAKIEKKESKLLIEIALPTIANYDSVLEKTSGIPGFIYDYWSSETSQQAKNKIEHSILRSWREILPVINNAMFTEATVQLVVCLCNKITTIPFMALELVQCLPPVMGQLVEIDEKGIPHSNIGHTKAIFQSLFQSLDMQFLKTDESSALGFLYEPIACKVMELPNLMYLKFVCQTEATEVTGAQKFRAVKESMTRFPCCATLKRCTFSLQPDGQLWLTEKSFPAIDAFAFINQCLWLVQISIDQKKTIYKSKLLKLQHISRFVDECISKNNIKEVVFLYIMLMVAMTLIKLPATLPI